jgi:hypothetical protein
LVKEEIFKNKIKRGSEVMGWDLIPLPQDKTTTSVSLMREIGWSGKNKISGPS